MTQQRSTVDSQIHSARPTPRWRLVLAAATIVGVVALALFAGQRPARASVITSTTSSSFPISLSLFVPCAAGGTGEVVNLTGSLHAVFSVTINDNDLHLNIEFNPQGVSGTGQTTGASYQGTGVTRTDTTQSAAIFPATLTEVNNFRIIGTGPGNDFMVHDNLHLTVNADGTLTAGQDNFSFTCS